MIPSKTPKDNSSQPDGSSLGLPARKASPSGQRSKSSAETASGLSAHVPKPPPREPMLSDEKILDDSFGSEVGIWYQKDGKSVPNMQATCEQGMNLARAFYEEKITSGELHVVKTCFVAVDPTDSIWTFSCCGLVDENSPTGDSHNAWNFCPGCGAKIDFS